MENEFKPVDFKSENDLISEIDILLDNISDVQKDWKQRENTIKKIGGILSGKWGKNLRFVKLFNTKIITNLSIQMLDLRTTVMREACNIVAFAAKHLGSQFEQSALYVVSSAVLFKLVASANKVISEGGSVCLEEVIKNVHSNKVMMKIIEQSINKNTCARLRAAQNFLYIITNYERTSLEKNVQSIEEFIISIAHDASPEVRNTAKSVFLKFMQIYPNKAEGLLLRLDNNIQKVIRELIRNSGKLNEINNSNSNPFGISESKKINLMEENYKTHSILLKSPTKNDENRKINNYKEFEKDKVPNKLLTINNNYNNISNNTTDNSTSIKNSKSKSSMSNKSVNSSPKVVRTPQRERENENRKSIKRPSINKSINVDNSINNNTDIIRSRTSEEKIPIPNQNIYKLDAEIKELIIKANSSYLSIKIAAIEKIVGLLKSNNFDFSKISNIVLEKLIESFTNLIKEDNNCARFTMDIISTIINKVPSIFKEYHITKMIQPVIENIASNTTEISQSASNLLINLKKTYDPLYITKPVIGFLDNDYTDEKYIVCLEVISIMFNLIDDSLKDQELFNNLVLNLASLLYQKNENKEILFRVVDIFEKIYKNHSNSLSTCFNSYMEDYEIKKNLVKTLEYYKKEISEFIITNNSENNKQNKNIYTNSNMKIKDSEKKENKLLSENKNLNFIDYANKSTPVSNQKLERNQNEIRRFPEDYSNMKLSNSSILIKSYKLDSKAFSEILSMNENNVEEFLQSLNKIQQAEINHVLEHISYCLRNKTFLLNNNLDLVINRLITLYENYPDNYELINQNFNLISSNIEPNIFLSLVSRYICQSSPAITQIILNTLNNSFSKCNKDHLLFLVPKFIDSLFLSINHKITEIRKLAVFCIVELYIIIGPEFDIYLNQLNTAQRNLISIYINKRTKKF